VTTPEFTGGNPFYLMFVSALDVGSQEPVDDVEYVDLDRPGWLVDQGHIFRDVGDLHLVRKDGDVVVMSVRFLPGEQGYYVARHVGTASGVGVVRNEVTAYGIGKKRVDGNEDNLWLLPWGQVCVGRDVEHFALLGLRRGWT
jgi:hypothetical protein